MQSRIHIDDVRNQGCFVELEVVLREEQSDLKGVSIANYIMSQLDIVKKQLVKSSYIYLLLNKMPDETQEIQD